jgi:hypothetical protein
MEVQPKNRAPRDLILASGEAIVAAQLHGQHGAIEGEGPLSECLR